MNPNLTILLKHEKREINSLDRKLAKKKNQNAKNNGKDKRKNTKHFFVVYL
jgi:hypothetical protein